MLLALGYELKFVKSANNSFFLQFQFYLSQIPPAFCHLCYYHGFPNGVFQGCVGYHAVRMSTNDYIDKACFARHFKVVYSHLGGVGSQMRKAKNDISFLSLFQVGRYFIGFVNRVFVHHAFVIAFNDQSFGLHIGGQDANA